MVSSRVVFELQKNDDVVEGIFLKEPKFKVHPILKIQLMEIMTDLKFELKAVRNLGKNVALHDEPTYKYTISTNDTATTIANHESIFDRYGKVVDLGLTSLENDDLTPLEDKIFRINQAIYRRESIQFLTVVQKNVLKTVKKLREANVNVKKENEKDIQHVRHLVKDLRRLKAVTQNYIKNLIIMDKTKIDRIMGKRVKDLQEKYDFYNKRFQQYYCQDIPVRLQKSITMEAVACGARNDEILDEAEKFDKEMNIKLKKFSS